MSVSLRVSPAQSRGRWERAQLAAPILEGVIAVAEIHKTLAKSVLAFADRIERRERVLR